MHRARLTIIAAFWAGLASSLLAGERHYSNSRFGYELLIPQGFSEVREANNGDGGVSTSILGHAELRVWGSYLLDGDLEDDITSRIASDRQEGWDISYERRQKESASWSGLRDGRIMYSRAMSGCDGAAVYFRFEYDEGARTAYDKTIGRLVKSLKPAC